MSKLSVFTFIPPPPPYIWPRHHSPPLLSTIIFTNITKYIHRHRTIFTTLVWLLIKMSFITLDQNNDKVSGLSWSWNENKSDTSSCQRKHAMPPLLRALIHFQLKGADNWKPIGVDNNYEKRARFWIIMRGFWQRDDREIELQANLQLWQVTRVTTSATAFLDSRQDNLFHFILMS